LITNKEILQQFEDDYIQQHPLDIEKELELFSGLWEEGIELGVLPPKDLLEGIEIDIKISRIVNCLKNY